LQGGAERGESFQSSKQLCNRNAEALQDGLSAHGFSFGENQRSVGCHDDDDRILRKQQPDFLTARSQILPRLAK
jgi:hypothetical protein